MKKRLYVFAGKPGAGKTTIINKVFAKKAKIVDVLPFIEQFRVGRKVLEHKTITAYENMYAHLGVIEDPVVVLEIGTNHPEFNISEIEKLQNEYDVSLFLCEASRDTCYQRAVDRGMRHDTEAWEMRMQRDFPNIFIKLLNKTSLSYHIINMDKSLEETTEQFKEFAI